MNMNKIRGNFRINILLTPLKYNKTFLCEILRPACNCMGESVKTCGQSLPKQSPNRPWSPISQNYGIKKDRLKER